MKPFDIAADEGSSVHSKKGVEVVVRVNEDQRATVALLRNGAGQHLLRWRSHDATALRVQRNGAACELRAGECSLYGYPVCELVPAEASKGKKVTRSLKEDALPVLEELLLALLRDDDAERYSLVHDDDDGRPQHRRPSWKGAGSKFLSPRGDKPAAAAAAAAPTKPNWERTMKRMDNFGACPIHGLLLATSDAAVVTRAWICAVDSVARLARRARSVSTATRCTPTAICTCARSRSRRSSTSSS